MCTVDEIMLKRLAVDQEPLKRFLQATMNPQAFPDIDPEEARNDLMASLAKADQLTAMYTEKAQEYRQKLTDLSTLQN